MKRRSPTRAQRGHRRLLPGQTIATPVKEFEGPPTPIHIEYERLKQAWEAEHGPGTYEDKF